MVEWFFKNQMKNGTIEMFDGVSLIQWTQENKIEFYQNKNLITTIKYSNIATLAVEEGNEDKNKKKEYVTISYRETSNKKNADKNAKIKKYYISPSYYCANDFKMIKEVIKSKNPEVKFNENLSKYIKEQYIKNAAIFTAFLYINYFKMASHLMI